MPSLRNVAARERKNKRRREPPMIVTGRKVRLINEILGRRARAVSNEREKREGSKP
jgi:hypothetical protein